MTTNKKHALQTVLEDLDFDCRSYSGRGMYGESCLAIAGGSIGSLIAGLVEFVWACNDASTDCISNVRDIVCGLENMRSDSIGVGSVFYFPGVPFYRVDEDEDE